METKTEKEKYTCVDCGKTLGEKNVYMDFDYSLRPIKPKCFDCFDISKSGEEY